jgi:hypothetical protein
MTSVRASLRTTWAILLLQAGCTGPSEQQAEDGSGGAADEAFAPVDAATGADASAASALDATVRDAQGGADGGADAARGERSEGGAASDTGAQSGAEGGVAGSSSLADMYPCDGDPSAYDALVTKRAEMWTATQAGRTVYTGTDTRAAVQAGIDSLSSGRTSKQSVLVQGSGTISANERINLASYLVLNVCGTLEATGSGSGDKAPLYARARREIDIPHVTIAGAPPYGMFFRDVDGLHIGRAELRLSGGLGIRVDNHGRENRADKVDGIRIDDAFVEGASTHAVETYGANDVTIGSVVARKVGGAGLLLNDSTHVEVGLVDAIDTATGTGYAAFRVANDNGAIDGGYPTNIHVGKVVARGGGRGFFCVTRSGGLVIDRIDIADTGNNAILIQNCHNVTVAAIEGTVAGPGSIQLAFDSQGCASCENSSDIAIQNLSVSGAAIREDPCAENSTFENITRASGTSMNVCD